MHNYAVLLQGFKAQKNKQESGGKKSFHDESDNKGYHSKYDHFDSFHESTSGGSEEKSSHNVSFTFRYNVAHHIAYSMNSAFSIHTEINFFLQINKTYTKKILKCMLQFT